MRIGDIDADTTANHMLMASACIRPFKSYLPQIANEFPAFNGTIGGHRLGSDFDRSKVDAVNDGEGLIEL